MEESLTLQNSPYECPVYVLTSNSLPYLLDGYMICHYLPNNRIYNYTRAYAYFHDTWHHIQLRTLQSDGHTVLVLKAGHIFTYTEMKAFSITHRANFSLSRMQRWNGWPSFFCVSVCMGKASAGKRPRLTAIQCPQTAQRPISARIHAFKLEVLTRRTAEWVQGQGKQIEAEKKKGGGGLDSN